jgi:hypothetical protein
MKRAPAVIPAGGEVTLQVDLPTEGLSGPYDGALTLQLPDGAPDTLALAVTGVVRQPIAFEPGPAFYLAGHQGESASQAIEILNREPAPLSLSIASTAPEGTTVRLETVEPGRRFRLVLMLGPTGPKGQKEHDIILSTSDPSRPTLRVRAHTWRRQRVDTFPESVDMGAIPIAQLAADPGRHAQTLMVYQRGGTDFTARFTIDAPALTISAVRGPKGDRYQATLAYDPRALAADTVSATLVIETNDAEFPRIEVPVRGTVLPN